MKTVLTKREQGVLDWIKSFQQAQGGYPTYREIQTAFGFSSINSVAQYLKQLAKKGFVDQIKNRGYRLPAQHRPRWVELPLLGAVQAGSPNQTQEEPETMILPQQFVPTSARRAFLLRVRGNSMSEAGIHEDDLVIVDQSSTPKVGDIVVALLEGENTVKRLAERKGKRYLLAESKEHPDIFPESEWEIQGVVRGLWRNF